MITAGRGCGIKISTIFIVTAAEMRNIAMSSPMAADVNATMREYGNRDTVKTHLKR